MTLNVRALLERSSIRPGQKEQMHLLVDVKAIGAPVDEARPALSVIFVLDASGSMAGTPLSQVIASVDMLVDLLAPADKVGVVSFSDEAAEVCALQLLTPEAKRLVKRRTASIRSLSSTNIEAGLLKAKSMLGPRRAHERQVILLLSDGAPNLGASSAAALTAVVEPMRQDANVATLGYGASHNSDILHAIATAGGGQYWFIANPQEASLEFARAVGAQADIVADSIEVVFSPDDACEVKEVLGQRVRFSKSGPIVAVPDLREQQSRLLVASLDITAPKEPGRLDVAAVTVRYRKAGKLEMLEEIVRVTVDVVDREPQLVVEAHQVAMMARAEIVRTDARAAADKMGFDQAAAMLRKIIASLEKVPGYVAGDGGPLSECVEQLVDEAVEYEQRPSAERYAAFKASQLGVEVSQGAKHAAAWGSSSQKSIALMRGAAGVAVDGFIVVKNETGAVVQRVALAHELSVGRTPGNDIVLPLGSLSKRHTRFVCRDGKVIVVDMHSTNGTYVNGARAMHPVVIGVGDKVNIGSHTFELELTGAKKPETT